MADVDSTAITNTITTSETNESLDVELIESYTQELSRLTDVLGIVSPSVVSAGTALFTYEVTGNLDTTEVAEGAEVPLSQYEVSRTPVGAIEMAKYRKLTTAEAIQQSGYENAVLRTDRKMLSQIRNGILKDFFDFLDKGTGTASGTGLQGALAQADAALMDAMETNGDAPDSVIHFVNPHDVADYLANAQVTLQTVFGMQYIQSFLGVTDIFVTNRVPENQIYVTPAENIHLYGIDFGSLGQAGLTYTTQDGALIGVHHEAAYDRVGAMTNVLSGALLFAEVTNYIVKADIE